MHFYAEDTVPRSKAILVFHLCFGFSRLCLEQFTNNFEHLQFPLQNVSMMNAVDYQAEKKWEYSVKLG